MATSSTRRRYCGLSKSKGSPPKSRKQLETAQFRSVGKCWSCSNDLPPSHRRGIMHQMIHIVQQLHDKRIIHGDIKLEKKFLDNQGKLWLCDLAEGRYLDEDEHVQDGKQHCTNRLLRSQRSGRDPPPAIIDNDLYGLDLSIWQLYTGRILHGDLGGDDVDVWARQLNGETVSVTEVQDWEVRSIITNLLRQGGARI
ncbi:hypothetical protein N657DRAFT_672778 [Parathielavia appendiculata]|uniref:Protein kinase domain-containing protein n=1 Tax=Parathielavia appendiculata TaxID=2587402 RepID=A0AAN6TWQ8_9PEZI|nr:hypothetical protein N657DRAFT_672778 [Parathielavia appendiculata]